MQDKLMRLTHIALTLLGVMIVELYLLITIGGAIGALPTIALVFLTSALGVWMMRKQGFSVLRRAQLSAIHGQAPLREVSEGALILIGGLLLLLPGFFTDVLGLVCLLPPTRFLLLKLLGRKGRIVQQSSGTTARNQPRVLEGEWERDER